MLMMALSTSTPAAFPFVLMILDEQKSLGCPIQPSIFGLAIEDNTVSRCKKIKTVNQKQETSSTLGRKRAKSSVMRSASKRNIMAK